MIDPQTEFNDPRRLLSRELDEALSAEDRLRLEAWLAESEGNRIERDRLAKLSRLLQEWAHPVVTEQQADLADAVHVRLAANEKNPEFDTVDDALRQWGRDQPEIDWNLYSAQVLIRIKKEQRRKRAARVVFRIGAPLAAAAALVFAWTAGIGVSPPGSHSPTPRVVVRLGPSETAGPAVNSTAVVSFDRESRVVEPKEVKPKGIVLVMAGGTMDAAVEEEAPL
jgi:hypothetical protein